MEFDAEFYFLLGAALLLVFFLYIGLPKWIGKSLDARIDGIKNELDEAARLRAEAQALLDSFAARTAEAEQQAVAIVAQAKSEAEVLAKEAQARLEDYIARRKKQADDKIALAEANAIAEVRSAAADAAVKAAESVLKASGNQAAFVDQGIASVKALVN
ncbi:ATP F0F1 synthase subunit B [Rhodoblastus sphagnicola]|uniref:ATP synthase subunit b n=1 Tax=Rhodoblastus sphagnicola TaxID=333368 RepID=A0A2S6N7P4_9HYPH|nr:ATP F0F1 synthase subunit B [Rhodoblastus sphagnicola]MBB4196700.1 F-type H+-transporting ATPase subunit b [Rhodoblastus sphagnicola]PPQ30624.1 ATP F0F1 synthase subunit B [Rhodoblastus sphagnicola]